MIPWSRTPWQPADYRDLLDLLHASAEPDYAAFVRRIIAPDLNNLGVRSPALRKVAKEIIWGDWRSFVALQKPSELYEERLLEAMVIATVRPGYDESLQLIAQFVPRMDNWALVDVFAGKSLITPHRDEFWQRNLDAFLIDKNPWLRRLGTVLMMANHLDAEYLPSTLQKTLTVPAEEYYVQMALAWLIASAAAADAEATASFLSEGSAGQLSAPIRKMAAQKIRDSFRVSAENKDRFTVLLAHPVRWG